MLFALGAAAVWLALSAPVAVVVGRSIRTADRRSRPAGCAVGCPCDGLA